ncbi:MFS transporter [Occultella gossypii]|uniref:MFS transporter n=1 Tax=Occultella gossypii TaxID=2800820 RepID=A0ABS7SBP6_9MICO|nr:MFS transporter [Occultella gossypii]MBZ2197791.1 MFS transporter [Occultella gossypii]
MATTPLSAFRTGVICLALLLEGMSSSSINVQIHAMASDLGLRGASVPIVVGAFLLAYAGCLPVAGRITDVWSRREVFRLGVVLFGVGCILCAVAPGAFLLVAGRLIQGAGAALSAPAALALITAGLGEGAARNRAVAIYGAMGAAGFSLGLVLPGFVVAQVGWRRSFVLLVPIVVAVLAVTARLATNTPAGGRVDVPGAMGLTAILILTMHALGGLGSTRVGFLAIELGLAAVVLAWLVRRGGVGDYPTAVLASRRIRAACLGLAGVYAAVLSSMLALSLGLQGQGDLDAFALGLLILPQPVAFTLTAGLGSRLVSRFGPARVMTAGAVVLAASLGYLAVVGVQPPWVATMLPAMAGIGVALGLAFPAASIAVVDAAAEVDRGTASSLLTTAQNVGGALGVAALTALALLPGTESAGAGDAAVAPGGPEVGPALVAGIAMLGLAVAVAAAILGRSPRAARDGRAAGPARDGRAVGGARGRRAAHDLRAARDRWAARVRRRGAQVSGRRAAPQAASVELIGTRVARVDATGEWVAAAEESGARVPGVGFTGELLAREWAERERAARDLLAAQRASRASARSGGRR